MIAPNITFDNLAPDVHVCTSTRTGDVITWLCPHCPGYVRTLNMRTGAMYMNRAGSTAAHTGCNSGVPDMAGLTVGHSEN